MSMWNFFCCVNTKVLKVKWKAVPSAKELPSLCFSLFFFNFKYFSQNKPRKTFTFHYNNFHM